MRRTQNTSTWSRAIAVVALVFAAPAISGCGSTLWPTDEPYNPGVGVNDRAGSVNVLNALVVSGAPGSGTFIATLVNRDSATADQLISVDVEGMTVGGGVNPALPASSSLNLASAVGGVVVSGDPKLLAAGRFISVRLTFAKAEPVTIKVPIVANRGPYADLAPSAAPTN